MEDDSCTGPGRSVSPLDPDDDNNDDDNDGVDNDDDYNDDDDNDDGNCGGQ